MAIRCIGAFDLYSAFDTVSYSILLSQMEHFVGIKGTAMVQVFFFLSKRSFLSTLLIFLPLWPLSRVVSPKSQS